MAVVGRDITTLTSSSKEEDLGQVWDDVLSSWGSYWLEKEKEEENAEKEAAKKAAKIDIEIIKQSVHAELKTFDQTSLRKPTVYFANCSHYTLGKRFLPATHGTAIIGNHKTKDKKAYAVALAFTISPMHTPYEVSHELFNTAINLSILPKEDKDALKKLKGKHFPSTEHFFRELTNEIKKPTTAKNKQAVIDEVCHLNGKNPRILIFNTLNLRYNKNIGGGIPISYPTGYSNGDQKFFEEEISSIIPYPNIEPEILRDKFRQQILSIRYLEEKAGIGKATTMVERPSLAAAQRPLNLIPAFKLFPEEDHLFSSNCNKATATLLQLAENESALKQNRKPQTITGASIFGYGSSQRVFLWEPLTNGLRRQLFNLLGVTTWDIKHVDASAKENEESKESKEEKAPTKNNTMFKAIVPTKPLATTKEEKKADIDFQLFVDNKKGILHLIKTLPPHHQQDALMQILDSKTTLGKVFLAKPTDESSTPEAENMHIINAQAMLQDIQTALPPNIRRGYCR